MLLTALVLALSSCLKTDVYQGDQESQKEFNDFDFSTVQNSVNLEVNYLNSGVEANVYFEVYGESPVTAGEYSYVKKEGILPLFSAYTNNNGVFTGNIELPTYLKKVYIYTPAFFAQTLIESEITNGNIKATDNSPESTKGSTKAADESATRATSTFWAHDSYMSTTQGTPEAYSDKRWKNWLGSYNQYKNGEIGYKYNGELAARSTDRLYEAQTQVINIHKSCPQEYRSYSDMYINEDAEVAVTFLGQNTCWNCSMGYYYYKNGEEPASLNEADIVMLFPNTQDGQWRNYSTNVWQTAGIDRLTAVQLKYYPHIADGNMEGATTTFPAGYKIGFVLANNAWSNRISGYGANHKYRAATSEGLSVDNGGQTFGTPRTAVYKYGDWVMISFEDHVDDENFSDIVMTLKSNPVDAITDIVTVDPEDKKITSTNLKGVYAFEDMWPSKGDYDMNDVMVRYEYGKTFDTDNLIYAETFTFKVFENIANNNNGLAFRLNSNGSVSSTTCSVRKAGEKDFTEATLQYEAADNVYILTDNVKNNMEGEYRITVNYSSPVQKESEIQPFIFKNEEGGKRWEVHLPKEKPTSKAVTSYFGTYDDASKPAQNIYYVREGSYPFAIYLSGADVEDLQKSLQKENERIPIDQLYSGYKNWVESNGTQNKDWYKQ